MPVPMELEPGSYQWCGCGKSKKVPFCDGTYEGSEHASHQFAITVKKRVVLCNCQHTNKPPYCDGSHDFYR
ncbi:MAG: CDGSH iron-sulfur domain-containing protein [Planctomycetes bacterium]|nr:CDGSH iron-sulfur domain-containing protein [Planctomycetota bacterium]